jgi:putative transposase
MSNYRRSLARGAIFFFTVTLADRQSDLLVTEIERLRRSYRNVQKRYPFKTIAICILPDHLHAIWELPPTDADFSLRWSLVKRGFSTGLNANDTRSASKKTKREKGVWQRRFWEHEIRDDRDLENHVAYVYSNPVKHGLVTRPIEWPFSSFHRDVELGIFTQDWMVAEREGDVSKYGE